MIEWCSGRTRVVAFVTGLVLAATIVVAAPERAGAIGVPCAERVTGAHTPWAFGDGGPTTRQAYQASAAEPGGDVISTGWYFGNATIGLSTDPKVVFTSSGYGSFLTRHRGDGSLAWAHAIASGTGFGLPMDVAVRGDGSIVTTGRFGGATTFGEGAAAVTVPDGTTYRGYVASFDADGTLQWVRTFSATARISVNAIAVDAAGDAIMRGEFAGSLTFDASALAPLTATDFNDSFVVSYAPDGTAAWRRGITGVGHQGVFGDSRAGAGSIGVTPDGDVLLVGGFGTGATFDVGDGTTRTLTGNPTDLWIFTARYHPDGTLVAADVIGAGPYAIAYSISVASDGTFAIAGFFNGPYTFGSGPSAVAFGATVFEDGFVARYASDGALLWAHTIESTELAEGFDVAISSSGAITVGGIYLNTAVAHGGSGDVAIPPQPMPAASFTSAFVARYTPDGDVAWVQVLVNANAYGLAAVGDDVVAAGEFENWAAMDPDVRLCDDGTGDGYLARYGDGGAATLHGTVRDGASNPLEGVTVTIMSAWPGWSIVRTTSTARDGTYLVSGLPAGTYRVRWFDGLGRYNRRWAGDSDTYRHGADLVVAPSQVLAVDGVLTARAGGSLGGSVVNGSGVGVADVVVQVFLGDAYFGGVRTNVAGGWRVRGLPPGSYRVRFVDPTGAYATEWYDDDHGVGPAHATTIAVAGAPVTIAATLAP